MFLITFHDFLDQFDANQIVLYKNLALLFSDSIDLYFCIFYSYLDFFVLDCVYRVKINYLLI